jgi:hypothetical protein
MENKSDKLLRDKLKGVEFPFDEKSWQQMEQMLDGKKKTRGFFFWWLNGIAALLVLGVGGYFLFYSDYRPQTIDGSNQQIAVVKENASDNEQQPAANIEDEKSNLNNSASITDEKQAPVSKTISENFGSNIPQRNTSKNELNRTNNIHSNSISQHSLVNKTKQSADYLTAREKNAEDVFAANIPSKNSEVTDKQTINTQSNNIEPVAEIMSNDEAANETLIFQDEIEEINNVATINEHTIDEQTTNEQQQEDSISSEKENEESITKPKKKKFQYSLGVIGAAAATIGRTYSDKPSYFAGFINDFLFFKRFALTTGFAYSNTSFTKVDPISELYEIPPIEYSSVISELMIPVGVKIYPVSLQHFRMYVHGGIINHIKLKETFEYIKPPVEPNPPAPTFEATDFPTQTNFNSPAANTQEDMQNNSTGSLSGGRSIHFRFFD